MMLAIGVPFPSVTVDSTVVLTLVVALIGAIWGTLAVLRGSLVVACLGYLVVAACFGYDFLKFNLGPAPLTLDRLAFVGLVAAFVVQWRLGRTKPRPLCSSDVMLGLLLMWLTVSTLTHDFRTPSPDSVSPVWRLLAGYFIPATVYWIARLSPLTERGVKIIRNSLIGFGLYLAVTGILEIAQQWSLVFPRHIANPQLGLHFGRARGPMLTSVSFGLYLAVGLLAGWIAWPRLRRLPQLLLLMAFPLAAASLYFSYTRSVWAGAALGLIIMLGVTLQGRVRKLVLCSLVSTGLLASVVNLQSLVNFQRETSASDTRDSTRMRVAFAYVSWRMFQEQPILGHGFGHFPQAKLNFLSDRSTDLNLQAIRSLVHHNTLLSLLTETGVIGLSLFLLMCWTWLRSAWELYRSPFSPPWARSHAALFLAAFGVYTCQLLFHELSYSTLDNALLFFLAGVAVGLRPLASGVPAALPMSHIPSVVQHSKSAQPVGALPIGV